MLTQFHQTATGYFKKQTVFTATSESMAQYTYSAPDNTSTLYKQNFNSDWSLTAYEGKKVYF